MYNSNNFRARFSSSIRYINGRPYTVRNPRKSNLATRCFHNLFPLREKFHPFKKYEEGKLIQKGLQHFILRVNKNELHIAINYGSKNVKFIVDKCNQYDYKRTQSLMTAEQIADFKQKLPTAYNPESLKMLCIHYINNHATLFNEKIHLLPAELLEEVTGCSNQKKLA